MTKHPDTTLVVWNSGAHSRFNEARLQEKFDQLARAMGFPSMPYCEKNEFVYGPHDYGRFRPDWNPGHALLVLKHFKVQVAHGEFGDIGHEVFFDEEGQPCWYAIVYGGPNHDAAEIAGYAEAATPELAIALAALSKVDPLADPGNRK